MSYRACRAGRWLWWCVRTPPRACDSPIRRPAGRTAAPSAPPRPAGRSCPTRPGKWLQRRRRRRNFMEAETFDSLTQKRESVLLFYRHQESAPYPTDSSSPCRRYPNWTRKETPSSLCAFYHFSDESEPEVEVFFLTCDYKLSVLTRRNNCEIIHASNRRWKTSDEKTKAAVSWRQIQTVTKDGFVEWTSQVKVWMTELRGHRAVCPRKQILLTWKFVSIKLFVVLSEWRFKQTQLQDLHRHSDFSVFFLSFSTFLHLKSFLYSIFYIL